MVRAILKTLRSAGYLALLTTSCGDACFGQSFAIVGAEVVLAETANGAQILGALSRTPKIPSRGIMLQDNSFLKSLNAGRRTLIVEECKRISENVGYANPVAINRELNEYCEAICSPQEILRADRRRVELGFQRYGVFILEDPDARKILGLRDSNSSTKDLESKRLSIVEKVRMDFAERQVAILDEIFAPEQFRRVSDVLLELPSKQIDR